MAGDSLAHDGARLFQAMAGALLLAAGLAPDAAAQSAADRAMLTLWTDSLQHVSDATALAAFDGASRHGSGRSGDLRRALFQVRQADLTDNRGEIELVLTNMQVLATHTRWSWPHYVMALAFDALARKHWVETLSDGKAPAEKHSDATWRTLREALDLDPGFPVARELLGTLTAAGGDRFLRPDEVAALERESRQPIPDPNALLAWARHLRTVQDYHGALTAFDRAAARGGDASVIGLERARTLLALGDSAEAATAYWTGISHLSGPGRQAYRTDLWWIAEPDDLTSLDETPDAGIATWLHRFWGVRDAAAANHAGDRLREHLRRWVIAYQRYRALSPWTDTFWSRVEMQFDQDQCQDTDARLFEALWRKPPASDDDIRIGEPILDHRGMVYLRHGEPVRTIASHDDGGFVKRRTMAEPYVAGPATVGPTGARLPWSARAPGQVPDATTGSSSESWIYWFDGALHIISFRGSDALGHYGATTITETLPGMLLADHELAASLDIKEFHHMAIRMSANDTSIWGGGASATQHRDNPNCFNEVRAAVARMARDESASINRDSDTPPLFRGQNSIGLDFALGNTGDASATVLQTFAIPASALHVDHGEGGALGYIINLRSVAYDLATERTVELDTTRYFVVNRPLTGGEFLTGFTEYTLPPGAWQVATRASQLDGAVVLQDLHTIHVDSAKTITLSDIVTGRSGTSDWTATDGLPFPVNYPNGWYHDEAAELYFEVRGVPAGAVYRTTMEVRPMNPKASAVVRIESVDQANGATNYLRKSFGLTQLVPGTYRLLVTVQYQGSRAIREREILIVPRP